MYPLSSRRRSAASSRRLAIESLESRKLLAYGDSFRDLLEFGDSPPHVPFLHVTEIEPNENEADYTGLTSSTDAAILVHGSTDYARTDNFWFSASKGDYVVIATPVPPNLGSYLKLWVNDWYPPLDSLGNSTFKSAYAFRAPAAGPYVFGVGPSYVGDYTLGLAIIPNKNVVAAIAGASATSVNTPITLFSTSYDPEERELGDWGGITVGTGITKLEWSGGGPTYTFAQPGTYSVTLTVTSNDNETATATHDIVVSGPDLPTGRLTSLQFVEYDETARPDGAWQVLPDPGVVDRFFDSAPSEVDYLDLDPGGESDEEQPVLYVAGSVPVVDAVFKMPTGAFGEYDVEGRTSDGLLFTGSGDVDDDGLLRVTAKQVATDAFGNIRSIADAIHKFDAFVIQWQMKSKSGINWGAAGSSRNTLYVSAAAPDIRDLFETVVDVAIRSNIGRSSAERDGIIAGSFDPFRTDLDGSNVIKRVRDDVILRYYGGYVDDPNWPPPIGSAEPRTMLEMLLHNADGRCGNWTVFFQAVLGVNGLSSSSKQIKWTPDNDREFYVIDNWQFRDEARFDDTWYFLGENINANGMVQLGDVTVVDSTIVLPRIIELPGMEGQGRVLFPAKIFPDHWVLRIDGFYYDPSYGSQPIPVALGKAYWEQNAVAGYAKYAITAAQRAWGNSPIASEAASGNDWNNNGEVDKFRIKKSTLLVRPNTAEVHSTPPPQTLVASELRIPQLSPVEVLKSPAKTDEAPSSADVGQASSSRSPRQVTNALVSAVASPTALSTSDMPFDVLAPLDIDGSAANATSRNDWHSSGNQTIEFNVNRSSLPIRPDFAAVHQTPLPQASVPETVISRASVETPVAFTKEYGVLPRGAVEQAALSQLTQQDTNALSALVSSLLSPSRETSRKAVESGVERSAADTAATTRHSNQVAVLSLYSPPGKPIVLPHNVRPESLEDASASKAEDSMRNNGSKMILALLGTLSRRPR